MRSLPPSPDLSVLKTHAKHLLRDTRAGDADALRRIAETLPAARGADLADLARREIRLHDAQSVIAREYGFPSWTELKQHVDWRRADRAERQASWVRWVYDGAGNARRRALDALDKEPDLLAGDPWFACAVGDEATIAAALARDTAWAHAPGGPRQMPPLVAVTHSRLIDEPGFEAKLLACADLLLRHGADVNQTWTDTRFPDWPLSALYGAAGRTHNVAMTRLLLAAGADPNDNESLYHSVESRDHTCTRLLLAAGARVAGTNAVGRALDFDDLDGLHLLLSHGGDAENRSWLHHAILRGRSLAHVHALLDSGDDSRATDTAGVSFFRWAALNGRSDVTTLLQGLGIDETLTVEERFVGACAAGDEAAARAILADVPDIFSQLSPPQLERLPASAAIGDMRAVRTMLALGWPREVKTQWSATALNHAVFKGDAAMARLLLDSGADWRTPHGFDDNVVGALSYACQTEHFDPTMPRDYLGCAKALVEHGVPMAEMRRCSYSPDIAAYLEEQDPSDA